MDSSELRSFLLREVCVVIDLVGTGRNMLAGAVGWFLFARVKTEKGFRVF